MAKRRQNSRTDSAEFDVECWGDIDLDALYAEIDADNRRIAAAPHFAELRAAVEREFDDMDPGTVNTVVDRWQIAMRLTGMSLASALSSIARGHSSPYGRRGSARALARRGEAINWHMR